MNKTNKVITTTLFFIQKKYQEFEELFLKRKIFKTNKYWFSRQKKFYFELDKSKLQVNVFNETNLGEKLEKKIIL